MGRTENLFRCDAHTDSIFAFWLPYFFRLASAGFLSFLSRLLPILTGCYNACHDQLSTCGDSFSKKPIASAGRGCA